jgi:dienelactone hydrolase
VVGAVVAVVAAGVLAGCGGPNGGHSLIGDPTPIGNVPTTPTTVAPATTTAPTTTVPALRPGTTTTVTSAPAAQPPRPYAVGWTNLDLTDPSRPTGSAAGRHLPTLVFYPATGSNPATETQTAPGLYHSWPLVIFAEGYNTTPLTYHDLIHHLASSGFVVAAPSFPLETAGGTLNESDLSNEPQDIKFVITQLLAAGSGFGVLNGMIDPSRVALVGHSDGGEAVLGEAYDPGIADPRVGPVVAMSASGVLSAGKVPVTPKHDLLVVEGTADTINPPAQATALFQVAPSPKAYLQLLGAGHLPPMVDPNQWRPVVEATIVDWLDAWLGGPYQASAAGRLGHDADIPGTSQISLG